MQYDIPSITVVSNVLGWFSIAYAVIVFVYTTIQLQYVISPEITMSF